MGLNVIGLISGGKDSLYSLAHCIKNGHNLIAIANLHPSLEDSIDDDGEGSDLNSFMYQTVGHTIIPLYAAALGVPLYRRAISGTARQTGRYYDTSNSIIDTDETEDMYLLVQAVLQQHPEVNALNAGAILSTYQRTRVESVATRLGLTPLAYLWQYPALPAPCSRDDSLTGLLDDMSTARCDARIIKIASGGIGSNLLATNVAAPMVGTRLVSGLAPFHSDEGQEFLLRGAVLGEGGEYETLALDGPSPLWKMSIEVEFTGLFEAEGGTTYASFGKATAVGKDESAHIELPIPSLSDKRFAAVQSQLRSTPLTTSNYNCVTPSTNPSERSLMPTSLASSNTLQLTNIASPNASLSPPQQLEHIINIAMVTISDHCRKLNLPGHASSLQKIISTTLLLSSIDDFAPLNEIYAAKMWPQGLPNPPSRVTVAASLPKGTHVSLSLITDLSNAYAEDRKGLHVQSRSYWAPANIGPYSQAISAPLLSPQNTIPSGQDQNKTTHTGTSMEIVHMAGQIPLVPSSMAILDRSFDEQAMLGLQHLWRVGQERGVDLWAGAGVAYLARIDHTVSANETMFMLDRVQEAARIWRLSHQIDEKGVFRSNQAISGADITDEEDEDIDIWDLQQRNRAFGTSAAANLTVGDHLHILPNLDLFRSAAESIHATCIKTTYCADPAIPPFIAAEVSGLPRNAPIEWWSTGIAGLAIFAAKHQCRVWPVNQNIGREASLSGIAIEHLDQHSAEKADDRTYAARSPCDRSSFSIFVTLTIKMNVGQTGEVKMLQTATDLATMLFKEEARIACKIVTAHSFLNLSCASDTMEQLDKMQLVQQATLVPCYHVWALRTAIGDIGTGQGQNDNNILEEVAAATIFQIEAYPQ